MIQEQVQAWKWLKSQVKPVQDPILRNAMMAEFRKRAIRDWGYCPDDRNATKNDVVILDEWEQDFVKDLEVHQNFGLDTRKEKRKQNIKEAQARMRMFIESGGSLSDIPDDIRTPFITKMYYEALSQIGEILAENTDKLIGNKQ